MIPRHGRVAGPGPRRRRRPDRVPGRCRGDHGAVTAETAVALPAVVLVLAVVLTTGSAGVARLRCLDAARAAARVAAIGEADAGVAAVAERVAGGGATASVHRDGTWVEVTVTRSVPGSWFTGGRLTVSGSATAWAEP